MMPLAAISDYEAYAIASGGIIGGRILERRQVTGLVAHDRRADRPAEHLGVPGLAGHLTGLIEALNVVRHIDGIAFIHFDERDVVRHPLVQSIISAYDALDRERHFQRMWARTRMNNQLRVLGAVDVAAVDLQVERLHRHHRAEGFGHAPQPHQRLARVVLASSDVIEWEPRLLETLDRH